MTGTGSVLSSRDRAELVGLFLGATQAVAPGVTDDERELLRDVVDRMLQEWDAPLSCD